ncbi:hypothetical protein GGR54DRAFT_301649 [Hypoxylon sp. NC1633]|nr:hypothetical protein GGR54DRAFT_301649 [Hypoxylon sp. NC1633]
MGLRVEGGRQVGGKRRQRRRRRQRTRKMRSVRPWPRGLRDRESGLGCSYQGDCTMMPVFQSGREKAKEEVKNHQSLSKVTDSKIAAVRAIRLSSSSSSNHTFHHPSPSAMVVRHKDTGEGGWCLWRGLDDGRCFGSKDPFTIPTCGGQAQVSNNSVGYYQGISKLLESVYGQGLLSRGGNLVANLPGMRILNRSDQDNRQSQQSQSNRQDYQLHFTRSKMAESQWGVNQSMKVDRSMKVNGLMHRGDR